MIKRKVQRMALVKFNKWIFKKKEPIMLVFVNNY